ncbi:amino acid adenylation domain-containing protein [Streptosporangium subroseum]|uniref:Amino acid adenylation domain-containing protein n=1 Tax=Streptosporangium subroseum TaxID=106412 RepID=A0A239BGH8_9ACTN|nr:non-ribosomal peptide synthetase [Streptosporangium subroseum]SNS06184.1 amino acid adenylation domain-containing protein [Streptosporangium subroseum]
MVDNFALLEPVHKAFEQQVRRTPQRTAIIAGTARTTYTDLNAQANRTAHELISRGVGRGSTVGVCLNRDETLIAALLGVWKTGAAYVPLDPAYPADRLRFIVEDAGVSHTVTSAALSERLPERGLVLTDTLGERPWNDPDLPSDPADLAYLMYTSGSTGRPKGVAIEHRNVMTLLRWDAGHFTAEELSGFLASTSVCFDPSVPQLYLPLLLGGTVIMAENPLALHTLPAGDEVTMISAAASALTALLREPLPPGVRTVLSSGEPVSRALADRVFANPGVRRMVNLYGPTECTVHCCAQEISRDETDEPPIGTPYAWSELSVRGADGEALGDDELGELWVAGPLVGRGYLNRPELTAERFVTDAGGVRHYRTGDLVRRKDGVYLYGGRIDDQVKVAGFRVELGEVQGRLVRHPLVNHAVVLAPSDEEGTRRLVAYVEPAGPGLDDGLLRSWLRDWLPDYMVPSRIVFLDTIPVGPTGKADRSRLPAVTFSSATVSAAEIEYVAPRGETEQRLAAITAEVLGAERVGVHDHFLDLGGHSLAAARICARIGQALGVRVPLTTFLARPTVAELASYVAEAAPSAVTPLIRHAGRTGYPLTGPQLGMYLLREVSHNPGSTAIAFRLGLRGLTSAEPLRASLDAIVRRHEALRSVVVDGVTEVGPPVPVPLDEHRPASAEEADELRRAAVAHDFDVSRESPLLRATLLWSGADSAELVLLTDHLVFDGWSLGVVMRELLDGLTRPGVPESAPPFQIGDVALREQAATGDTEALRAFWSEEFAGAVPPYELLPRRGDHPSSLRGERLVRRIDPATTARVGELAADCGATPFAVYLTVLGMLVAGLTDRRDVVLGAAVADRAEDGLEAVVGLLVDVVPVRLRLEDGLSLRAAVRHAGAVTARAMDHRALPAWERVEAGGVERPPGAVPAPVTLSTQPPEVPLSLEREGVGVDLIGELDAGSAQAPLIVYVNATVAGPELQVEYDVEHLDRAGAEILTDRLVRLLADALAHPDRPLSAFEVVGAEERAALLAAGTGVPLPADAPRTVVEAVLEQAVRHPHAPAVVDADGVLTYGELAGWSRRVAAALGPAAAGACVGVCLPRDRYLPAALLGVLLAGGAYVPLDPGHPLQRLRNQVDDSGTKVIIAAGEGLAVAEKLGDTVIDLAGLSPAEAVQNRANPDDLAGPFPAEAVQDRTNPDDLSQVRPGDLAYVLYTSGSTGRPKGVEITHANLAAFVASMRITPGIRPDDVMLGLTPFSFDVFGFDLWVSLCHGLRLELLGQGDTLDGRAVARRIEEAGVTLMTATPTTLRMLVASGWRGGDLRVVSIGEVLDPALAGDLLERVAELWNAYGPTETTIYSTMIQVTAPVGDQVSIGTPLAGERAYVLDRAGRMLPAGTPGELWIGGAGVARDYRARPELTAAAFTEDPLGGRRYRTGDLARWRPDGTLDFLGRRDRQVKVRGHRIELGEIETVLRESVADAAVTVYGGDHLVGYLAAPPGTDTGGLERRLISRLPDYMVPRRWVLLDALPVTASGKVDRTALPEPGGEAPRVPPSTEAELLVAEVWSAVLGRSGLGAHDDFFALGGHSATAALVAARLSDALDLRVPMRLLFEGRTLADYAARLESLLLDDLETGS